MRYRLTRAAIQDLISLTTYGIETFGQLQARKYHEALDRTFHLLTEMPLIGRLDEDHPGMRRFLHGRHVIVYREDEAGVLIVRLLHVAMDAPRHGVDGELDE